MTKKNTSNKGFTLVELIVVLVILAILAAILVPALLGYIDKAREKQAVLNAKSCLTASQAEMSSLYGERKQPQDITSRASEVINMADANVSQLQVACAGPNSDYNNSDKAKAHNAYTINYVYYMGNDGSQQWFDGSTWLDTAPATTPSPVYTIQ